MTLAALLALPEMVRLAEALSRMPGQPFEGDLAMKWAAIALVIRLGELGEPELLLIKRAEAENDPWSGHIACPGGRAEPEDRDLAHTAMRETWEETGIDLERTGQLLGALDDISPMSPSLPPLVVRPFVAAVTSAVKIIQSAEVAQAFWVPLSALRAANAWARGTLMVRGVPRDVSTFTHGEHMVWGLTERALKQLMERMAP